METTLLELAMPKVLQQIKDLLSRKGFIVQTMPTPNPVIVAYCEGNWLRKAKELIIEFTSVDKNVTKIEITAVIKDKKKNSHAEELVEENFATTINNTFKKVIHSSHGI